MEVNVNNSRLRPMSARRRPSMPNLLDAIPEISTATNKTRPEDDYVLPYDDIADIFASCQDNRYPVKNIFKTPPNSMSNSNSRDHITAVSPTSSTTYMPHSLSMNSLSGNSYFTSSSNTLLPITENAIVSSPNTTNNNNNNNSNPSPSTSNNPTNPNNPNTNNTTPSPHRNYFKYHRKNSSQQQSQQQYHNAHSLWMTTGLVPQFIVITFYEKWLIKKVR